MGMKNCHEKPAGKMCHKRTLNKVCTCDPGNKSHGQIINCTTSWKPVVIELKKKRKKKPKSTAAERISDTSAFYKNR
jgi:hypothetical protein